MEAGHLRHLGPGPPAGTLGLTIASSARLFDVSNDGPVLRVHVQPGARREAIVGTHGDALSVRTAAPPAAGRANEAVLALLARELGVADSALQITSGAAGRLKRVRISGMEPRDLERRLDGILAAARARR